jgi:hypothetical protein
MKNLLEKENEKMQCKIIEKIIQTPISKWEKMFGNYVLDLNGVKITLINCTETCIMFGKIPSFLQIDGIKIYNDKITELRDKLVIADDEIIRNKLNKIYDKL